MLAALALLFAHHPTTAQELKRRGILGVAAAPVPDDARAAAGLEPGVGILVANVFEGGGGERAGVKTGDIVVAINGSAVGGTAQFVAAAKALQPGSKVTFDVVRAGKRVSVETTLDEVVEKDPAFDILYRAVSVDGSLRRVVVTRPKAPGRYPAVLLVGGIGCYSIDNPLDRDDAYRKIVFELTRNGFATMRVEKSGIGDSQGAPCPTVDFETEIRGNVAGLQALKGYDFVDPKNVFIVGHSIGGISGPIIADRVPVKGIAAIATTGIWWFEYEMANTRRQLVLAGADSAAIDAAMRQKESCMHRLFVDHKTPDDILKDSPDCAPFLGYPAHYTYLQQVADQNPSALWKALDTNVLVVYGGADFVTSPAEHQVIVDVVNGAHPNRAKLVGIPNMDHFLNERASQAESFRAASTPGAAGTFNTAISRELLAWLKASVSRS